MEFTSQQRATLASALERIGEGKEDAARDLLRHAFNGTTGDLLARLVRKGAIARPEVGPGQLELTPKGASLMRTLRAEQKTGRPQGAA